MTDPKTPSCLKQLLVKSRLLAMLLLVVLPAAALAQSPDPPYAGPEKCAECHSSQMEAWKDSPHAQAMKAFDHPEDSVCAEDPASDGCTCLTCHTTDFDTAKGTFSYGGVTCEACHGPYVEEHPQEGIMQLGVDSSVCQDCHADTHEEWAASSHGQANVQCISCHLSHSQEFRLTDEALCGSCHREHVTDFAHTAHNNAKVTCTDCHTSAEAETGNELQVAAMPGGPKAPSHSFEVSSKACVNCHGQNIHNEMMAVASKDPGITYASVRMSSDLASTELAAKLKTVEETNAALKSFSITGLGVGIGIGGMLGIVFMLVCGCLGRRQTK